VFSSWHWYGFVMLWVIAGETESFSTNSLLALYMQAHPTIKYTVSQMNTYPTGVPAVGIVSTLFWATLTDFVGGKRYLVGYWIGITGVATAAMILVPDRSNATVFAAYYWAGTVYACQATFFAWANDVLRYKDDALRGVIIASMNMGSNVINAWWSIVFYGADTAPWFTVRLPSSLLRRRWVLTLFIERYVGYDSLLHRHGHMDGHRGVPGSSRRETGGRTPGVARRQGGRSLARGSM
jgi:ACS family pantothenate transporter-like MFS transporter